MFLVILSFTVTGIMIMNENYEYAIVSLCVAAFCVLAAFVAVIAGDEDKILDLSNPSLRNPRKSGSGKKVRYINRLTPDMAGGRGKLKSGQSSSDNDDLYHMNTEEDVDFYESVGNMRVYKRGEEIERFTEDDEY